MSMTVTSMLIGGTLGAALGLMPVLKDIAENHRRKQFRKQITAAVATVQLDYVDLQHIAESWSQDRKAVLQCLRVLLSDALAGDESKLSESQDSLRRLLLEHAKAEPYAELPENISLQLETLTKYNDQIAPLVEQLASSLSDLYSSNQRQLARQTKLAFWGVLVGALGVAVGVVSWLR